MKLHDIVLDHEQDVAWIIALWLRIHGGDPAPDGRMHVQIDPTAALLAITLSARLAEVHGTPALSREMFEQRLRRAGIEMCTVDDEQAKKLTPIVTRRCFDKPGHEPGDPQVCISHIA